jgi:hypothetical protein
MHQFIFQHPFISLCAVIWLICGIVAAVRGSIAATIMEIALGATVAIGVGYYVYACLPH